MTDLLHLCNHALGLCGETHPSAISFILGHNEAIQMSHYIQYLKFKYKNVRRSKQNERRGRISASKKY